MPESLLKMKPSAICLNGHKDKVWSLAWNPQGTVLASCSSDKTIRLWKKDCDEWLCKKILDDSHSRTIRSVAWSSCGKYLASASFDATVNIWEQENGDFDCIATLEGHENEVKCISWSVSGSFLASCSRDKSVWIWEVDQDQSFECISVLPSHSQDVKKIIFHPIEDILASASYDNTIKLYKAEDDDWEVTNTLEGHSSTVWSISFNQDGKLLASCSDDQTIRIWQQFLEKENSDNKSSSSWKCTCTLSGFHDRPIYDIDWCKLTSIIATGGGDDCIKLFKKNESSSDIEPIYELMLNIPDAHSEDVNSVIWNPIQAGLLASASDDGMVKVWDFSSLL